MIRAALATSPRSLARQLARKAGALAQARAEDRLLARRADPSRWRKARLLWPLFTSRSGD